VDGHVRKWKGGNGTHGGGHRNWPGRKKETSFLLSPTAALA
jgi:hypothetical protein